MLRQHYDKQRVSNFFDAVFSIALTVLILDVSAPVFKDPSLVRLWDIFNVRMAELIGYVVSFFVIAMFWKANVRNMGHTLGVDSRLLLITIFQLFFVVLLPFSTAVYVINFGSHAAFQWYAINVALISILGNRSIDYISRSDLNDGTLTRKHRVYYLVRGRTVTVVWLIAAAIATVVPIYISRGLFVGIFIVDFFVDRHWRKRIF